MIDESPNDLPSNIMIVVAFILAFPKDEMQGGFTSSEALAALAKIVGLAPQDLLYLFFGDDLPEDKK